MLSFCLWNCLQRVRRCGLVGRGESLGVDSEVAEAHVIPISAFLLSLLLMDQDVSFQLLLQHGAGFPAAMLPMMMDKD